MPDSDGKVEYEVRANYDKVGSDMDKANKEIEKSTSKWSGIIDGAKHKIGASLAELPLKATKAAWEMGTAFENGLAKVSTLVDTSQTDMQAIGDQLLDLSSKYGLEASGLAESAYNAISANNALAKDTTGLMNLLESSAKLAKAGFTDVDTATSATLKTLNAYGLGVEEADRIQKILIQTQNTGITTVGELGGALAGVTPIAAAMNVSFEQVGAGLATLTAKGVPTAEAVTQLKSLIAELGKSGTVASKGLAAATEGTKWAGKSFAEMQAKGVTLNEVLAMLQKEAEENELSLADMFGSIEAGNAALSLTAEGAEAFTTNLEAMSTEADVVGEGFDKVSGTNAEKLNMAFNKIKNTVVTLYNAFSPLISVLLDLANILLDKVSGAIEWVAGGISSFTQGVSDLWATITGGNKNQGSRGGARSHAVGLDSVPYNDYPAILHQHEMVLRPAEAAVYRAGGNARAGLMGAAQGQKIDYTELARAMSGMTMVMDDQVVGRIVERGVSAQQARHGESIRRSGFNGKL